jgi:Ca-activated chloride channel family protein
VEEVAVNEFFFAKPEMLWLLAVTLPLLVWFLCWSWHKRQQLIGQFVRSRLLAQLTVGVSARRQQVRQLLLAAAATFILLALARPELGFEREEAHQRGLDIIVAIDASRSMLTTDLSPNSSRLALAKLAALDLMRAARRDRLALVAFAGTAFLQCPLTLDDNAFAQSVNSIEAGIIPEGGTDIGEAINAALSAFKEGEDTHKVMVLLTDGEDLEGGAEDAAAKAARVGMRIFTIGVGTPQGERIRVRDDKGRVTYVTDENNQPVVSRLNTDLLQKIARTTGGDYLALRGADTLEVLYQARLAELPKGNLGSRMLRQPRERFQWPLGFAIFLLLIEVFLPDRKRVPATEGIRNATHASLRQALGFGLALLCTLPALASPAAARQAYDQGRYVEAEREYQRLLQKRPEDPRLRFNLGTTAYRNHDFQKATNTLNQAVLSSDPALLAGAYYNLGNTYYRLGEHTAAPQETMANWELSLTNYDRTLKLNPQDADARFNRELVAKKLEELRQQQSKDQQPSQDKKQDDKQNDKQDQRQDQKQEASKRPPDQDQKKKPDSPPEKQNPSQPDQAQKKPDQTPAKLDQPKPAPADEAKKPENASAADANPMSVPLGEMTPEQARHLLEAAKAEERPMIFVPPANPNRLARQRRDW